MVARTAAVVCGGWMCAAMALGQSPVVILPSSIALNTVVSGPACAPGFAEIIATHLRVSQDPSSAVLQKGTLHIKARRGWVEERGSTMISYKDADGTVVPEINVPIKDGALEHPACVPFTSVYVASPVRYQMTVTDYSTASSSLLLVVTADITQPIYHLDDNRLYRAEPRDIALPGAKTPLAETFRECAETSWCGRE